jgi:hypothetical protein
VAVALSVCCVSGSLAIGCGGGQSSPPAPAALSGTSSADAPSAIPRTAGPATAAHPTKAAALGFARAVNLTVIDVPEARVSRKKGGRRSSSKSEGSLGRCASALRPRKLVDAESPRLLRGRELEEEWIGSDVMVTTSAGAAARMLDTLQQTATRRCLARAISAAIGRATVRYVHWGGAKIYALAVPGAAGGAVGIRIAVTVTSTFSEVTLPMYIDVLGFARGPAVITLAAASLTQPVPAEVERLVFSTLLARAGSHRL